MMYNRYEVAYSVFIISTKRVGGETLAGSASYLFPTTYLKSSVKIISGDGTQDSPFQVSL